MTRKELKQKLMTGAIVFMFLVIGNIAIPQQEVKASTQNVYNSDLDGNTKTIYKDLTGDGKEEKISIKVQKDEWGWMHKFNIAVNGKNTLVLKEGEFGLDAEVQYVQLSKKQFLWVKVTESNLDPTIDALYIYRNKKLQKVTALDSENWKNGGFHVYTEKLTTMENGIKVTYNSQIIATGYITYTYQYQYKNGKFSMKNATAKVKNSSCVKNNMFTAKTPITFYTDVKMNKKAFFVKSGQKVKLLKIRTYKDTYYVQFQSGKKTGWIKGEQEDIFEEVELAG